MAMAMINSLHLVVVHISSEETQSQRNSLRDGYCQYHVHVIFFMLSDVVCQFPPATGGMTTGVTCYLCHLRSPVPVCDRRVNTSSICVGRRPQSVGGRQLQLNHVVELIKNKLFFLKFLSNQHQRKTTRAFMHGTAFCSVYA